MNRKMSAVSNTHTKITAMKKLFQIKRPLMRFQNVPRLYYSTRTRLAFGMLSKRSVLDKRYRTNAKPRADYIIGYSGLKEGKMWKKLSEAPSDTAGNTHEISLSHFRISYSLISGGSSRMYVPNEIKH